MAAIIINQPGSPPDYSDYVDLDGQENKALQLYYGCLALAALTRSEAPCDCDTLKALLSSYGGGRRSDLSAAMTAILASAAGTLGASVPTVDQARINAQCFHCCDFPDYLLDLGWVYIIGQLILQSNLRQNPT